MKEEDLRMWHGRLGHAPYKVVKHIPNKKFKVSGDRIKECTICPLARHEDLLSQKVQIDQMNPFN